MLGRAFIAMIVSGGLSLGALYGAGEYFGLNAYEFEPVDDTASELDGSDAAMDAETMDAETMDTETISEEDEFEGEPVIPLPAEAEADLAGWLASVLADETAVEVTNPYDSAAEAGLVDLAALSAAAAEPQPEAPAEPALGDTHIAMTVYCGASHVMLACGIGTLDQAWEDEVEGELIAYESYEGYSFSLQTDETGAWRLVEGSVQAQAAG